jgi:hypothetical protein
MMLSKMMKILFIVNGIIKINLINTEKLKIIEKRHYKKFKNKDKNLIKIIQYNF